ncbi:eukaryotic translation initiation factor 4E1-like [Epargyreus clarus]|uniref:eukaryotic translation initiation factor 4E1-like n=1 Tax=Epargyreus clarus TaxID=520877 RepID=UPI003C2FF8F8
MGDTGAEVMTGSNQIVSENSKESEDIPLEGIKHPLQNVWSFWMFMNEKRNWEENLIELTTFDTVEDYWCLYHHMKLPSELRMGQDYAVFKKGICPKWEDRGNKKGGRWLITIDKKSMNMDRIWMYVVLMLIGENFENSDSICGAVVNVRVKSKVGIWVSDSKNEKAIKKVGRKLKENLQIPGKISFHEHDSVTNLYTV